MTSVYFDSSALVKLLVEEDGSAIVDHLWDHFDVGFASRLAYPEVRAAVAAAGRNLDLDRREQATATQVWEQHWRALRPIEVTPDIAARAGDLATDHALSGADAVHLASVLAIAGAAPLVATWDRRLATAAAAAGLAVVPAP